MSEQSDGNVILTDKQTRQQIYEILSSSPLFIAEAACGRDQSQAESSGESSSKILGESASSILAALTYIPEPPAEACKLDLFGLELLLGVRFAPQTSGISVNPHQQIKYWESPEEWAAEVVAGLLGTDTTLLDNDVYIDQLRTYAWTKHAAEITLEVETSRHYAQIAYELILKKSVTNGSSIAAASFQDGAKVSFLFKEQFPLAN